MRNTLLFCKTIHAVVVLMILCVGDGLADLIGSRIKSRKIHWIEQNNSCRYCCDVRGWFNIWFILILLPKGSFLEQHELVKNIPALLITSILAVIVGSCTSSDWDNFSTSCSFTDIATNSIKGVYEN